MAKGSVTIGTLEVLVCCFIVVLVVVVRGVVTGGIEVVVEGLLEIEVVEGLLEGGVVEGALEREGVVDVEPTVAVDNVGGLVASVVVTFLSVTWSFDDVLFSVGDSAVLCPLLPSVGGSVTSDSTNSPFTENKVNESSKNIFSLCRYILISMPSTRL